MTEISRKNPALFLFLIDQSGSMDDSFGGDQNLTKKDGVADAINQMLQELLFRWCIKGTQVRDYFNIGVWAYGGNTVRPALGGQLAGKELVVPSDLYQAPLRIEQIDDTGQPSSQDKAGIITKRMVWLEAKADGNTPMRQAFRTARAVVAKWISQHQESYPPVIFNITDGEATDGDPGTAAAELASLPNPNGPILLCNCHISDVEAEKVIFPASEQEVLNNEFAKLLYRMSSELPPALRETARSAGFNLKSGSRAYAFNADQKALFGFLDVGTQVANNGVQD